MRSAECTTLIRDYQYKGIAAEEGGAKLRLMSLPHAIQDLRRNARLLLRHVRYGPASFRRQPSAVRTAALATLFRGVNAHLSALGTPYALAYGTLLGWYREQALIPHDYDIDFAAPVTTYPTLLASASRLPRGFELHDTSHRHRGPKLYVNHGGWEADIYFYTEEGDQLRSTEQSRNPGDMLPFPRAYFFPVQPVSFLGVQTFVPAQPEAVLRHVYRYLGPDAERDPLTRYFRERNSSG